MVTAAILLAFCLGSLAWFMRGDLAQYRAFKLLTETADRQRRYRMWTLKSFALFTCTTLAALAILGRLHALVTLPPEFRPLFQAMQVSSGSSGSFVSGMLIGIAGAVTAGVILGFLLPRLRRQRMKPLQLGDIAPLLPRNGAETVWTAVLSVNAGVGEELYFRLLLPLLLVSLGSGVLLAFVIAGLIFGAMHFYQGVAGIVATTILGGILAAAYLLSGSLWFAVALHAFIDLLGLVIRPSLNRMAASRGAARA